MRYWVMTVENVCAYLYDASDPVLNFKPYRTQVNNSSEAVYIFLFP